MKLAIYAGDAWRRWDPNIALEQGDGGAHMALVDIPPRLGARGWDVTVYANCATRSEFQGVKWVPYTESATVQADPADLLILWRRPELLKKPLAAKNLLFMARDMSYGQSLPEELCERVKCFAVLSDWHRRYWLERYPWTEQSLWVTRNGVDLSRFRGKSVERIPTKALYTSAPYRGLAVALKAWRWVRNEIPQAELHVYNGFEGSMRLAKRQSNDAMLHSLEILQERVRNTEGVVFHDRVGRSTIDQALLSAGVWFYPSRFDETSCAAAMEAQAAGCKVVTCARAALQESARFAYRMLPPRTTAAQYAQTVIGAMRDPLPADPSRAREAFDIERVADEWDSKFRELVS